jgi:cytochrome c-type biogenesis protein CcmH/NrfG
MTRTTGSTVCRLGVGAVAVLALSGGAVALSAGPVAAQPRDPCADRAHQAQVALDIAHGWWVLGETLMAVGDVTGAEDAYAYADYFFAEYEMYAYDPC